MLTRTRGYLPHNEESTGVYFVTFRLYDSLPQTIYLQYQQELAHGLKCSSDQRLRHVHDYEAKLQQFLDASYGACWLRDPRIAEILVDLIRKHESHWYTLHAYTIMPNHVHILLTPNGTQKLSEIVRAWKGASSFCANKILKRSGAFWQREYFDRLIKSDRQFEYAIRYIYRNPVKAGLCKEAFQWPWSGSSPEVQDLLRRFFV